MIKLIPAILVLATTALVQPAGADEANKLPTVGFAVPVDQATAAPFYKAFREGLQEAGYVDGGNVTLIRLYANGDRKQLRENIRELIALKVDVLFGDAAPLKAATTTIPIVSPTMSDPVKMGLVASLARPGGQPHRTIESTLRHRSKTPGVGD